MKKVYIFLGVFMSAFLFVGAGCYRLNQNNSPKNDSLNSDKIVASEDSVENKAEDVVITKNSEVVDSNESKEKVFDVTGKNFEFSLKEIKVNQGDKVKINFTSSEGFHDWVLDEFNVATEKIQGGQSASVTFIADKAGVYEYYCSVGTHRQMGMTGKLIVE